MPISQNCNPALLDNSANSWIYKLKVARRRKKDLYCFYVMRVRLLQSLCRWLGIYLEGLCLFKSYQPEGIYPSIAVHASPIDQF